jgi:hypothetical protein
MMRTILIALFLIGPAYGQTVYFNPVPNQLSQGALAKSADVNGNFASLVTDGNAAKTTIQNAISGMPVGAGLPSGAVLMFDVANCPPGFRVADGGGGSPDVRGLFIRGFDNGAGHDAGRTLGSYQADALANHSHGTGGASSFSLSGTVGGSGAAIGTGNAGGGVVGVQSGGLTETLPNAVVLLQCYKS